jgi:aquaporin Z
VSSGDADAAPEGAYWAGVTRYKRSGDASALGATHKRAPVGFAGLAIGLMLTLIHLISIPVTNTSVNPARSTGPAIFVGGWALAQLWMFWVAPIVGAAIAGFFYRSVLEGEPEPPPVTGRV